MHDSLVGILTAAHQKVAMRQTAWMSPRTLVQSSGLDAFCTHVSGRVRGKSKSTLHSQASPGRRHGFEVFVSLVGHMSLIVGEHG